MKDTPFRTSLTAASSYQLGEPILVTFEIENAGSEAYQVLTWGTPLEGQFTLDCFKVERDGERVPYDGKLVSRGDPKANSYVVIDAGERLEETIDISEAYAIDRAGEYSVTLKASFFDAFVVPGKARQAPRKRRNHERQKLTPATVQFKVVEGMEPRLTEGQRIRKVAKLADTSAKAPSFSGGTSSERDDVTIAHNNAQYFAALAVNQLDTTTANTNTLYQTWFGAFDQDRYDTVREMFADISDTLISKAVTYDLSGSGCGTDWNAYTYNGSSTVWTCSGFWSLPPIAIDCQCSTILHEWSHAVGGTDDHAYGDTACQNLATNHPADAVDNGDSYENFAERLAQSDFGKSLTLITDRSNFGKDEINAMLGQSSPAVVEKAFYVVVDGHWPDSLGITASSLGTSPSVKPTLTFTPAVPGITVSVTSLEAEDTSLPESPQRFTWVCQVAFSNNSGFPSNPGEVQVVTLTAALAGLSGSAQIQLICEPNPYELDGPTSWLSTDVRVFQCRAGESRFGATIGSTASDATAFIKQVIANLNSGSSGGQTFDSISTDPQTSSLELSEKINGINVFNFAIAKVRYRGTIDISNVRVFFRLFPAATTSTNFDSNTTYRRATQGTNEVPLLGLSSSGDLLTIPCFAESRVNSAAVAVTMQTDPANVRTIIHDSGGNEVAAYFGCWLDINQTPSQFPSKPAPSDGPWSSGRKSVQELMRNAHQCLVAEIAFDPDPIPAGASPGGSDKLAQRNLVIVESANPGFEASRRILTTFDLRPIPTRKERVPPDELLIDWGNTPSDSIASVYIPEVDAGQIIALANARYGSHRLGKIDGQTLRLPVGGISYVPLPPGTSSGLTGLLSVELPDTVRKGEVYTIVIRQVTNEVAKAIAPPPVVADRRLMPSAAVATHGQTGLIWWRRIIGSYQVTIPVRTKEAILPQEVRLLSVLRWILKSVSADDRWYPVFSRYVELIGERVRALGGDPTHVEPSPAGTAAEAPVEPTHEFERTISHDGKVTGIIYDCFGDFDGFLLDLCGREIRFRAREHRIEALALTAWRERMAITVITSANTPRRPISIILRRAPEPFQA